MKGEKCQIDSFGHIDLAAPIDRVLRAARFVQRGQTAPGENETLINVVGLVAPRESVNPQAGLEPLNVCKLAAMVFQIEPEIHVVSARPNLVQDFNVRLDHRSQPQPLPIIIRGNQLGLMRNGRLMPVPVRRTAAAEGFQIPDVHFASGNLRAGNAQHVIRPADGEAGGGTRRANNRADRQKE